MDKYIYDENNGLWYKLQGDCYLQEHGNAACTILLTNGKLNTYLTDIDQQVQERLERLIEKRQNS